jgi:hypothetical protein
MALSSCEGDASTRLNAGRPRPDSTSTRIFPFRSRADTDWEGPASRRAVTTTQAVGVVGWYSTERSDMRWPLGNHLMHGFDGSAERRRGLWCVGLSVGAILLGLVIVPGSMRANSGNSYAFSLPGRVLGILIGAACPAAFLLCPRRAALSKSLTFLLTFPGVFIVVLCLFDAVLGGPSKNRAVEALLLCLRLRWC